MKDDKFTILNEIQSHNVIGFVSPTKTYLSYEENHQVAEEMLSLMKNARYGSMVDGKGQVEIIKVGYVVENNSQNDAHIDTFVILGEEEHKEYIRKMLHYFATRFDCDFTALSRENCITEDGEISAIVTAYTDYQPPYILNFEWKKDNSSITTLMMDEIFTKGDVTPELWSAEFYNIEEFLKEPTNPTNYNDAMRLSGISDKVNRVE